MYEKEVEGKVKVHDSRRYWRAGAIKGELKRMTEGEGQKREEEQDE